MGQSGAKWISSIHSITGIYDVTLREEKDDTLLDGILERHPFQSPGGNHRFRLTTTRSSRFERLE